jgi:hypothetical protein
VFCHITGKGTELLQKLDPRVRRRADAAVEMLDHVEVDNPLQSLQQIPEGSFKE